MTRFKKKMINPFIPKWDQKKFLSTRLEPRHTQEYPDFAFTFDTLN